MLEANSAFQPYGVGKWVPALAGKAKAGMVHSVSGWTRGVQVKLWDPLRTSAIPERIRGVFTTRRYTNPRLPLTLPSDWNRQAKRRAASSCNASQLPLWDNVKKASLSLVRPCGTHCRVPPTVHDLSLTLTSGASLRLVSRGVATDGVTVTYFPSEKL